MKRRDFITKGAIGTASLSTAGCSLGRTRRIKLERKMAEHSFKVTHTKPSGGTMPTRELGTTGITVSKFGYGAHMTQELVPFVKERQIMIREAYDNGITLFDIYDNGNWNVFQYEPMGSHLAPMINDVVISLNMKPYDGRTTEQEIERALRVLGRDYIDMYRVNAWTPDNPKWKDWDILFDYKEKGYIRAVGIAIHFVEDIKDVLESVPIDYVIFPFNFYHNILWDGKFADDFNPLVKRLREKGVGVITMKPFGTDWFVTPLINAAKQLDKTGEISLPQAMLRYIINSGLNPDTTLGAMYNLDHVYENVVAYYKPEMSDEENNLLNTLREVASVSADAWMPDYYKFLETWTPDSPDSNVATGIV